MMYMACRHIKINGLPCDSPALKRGQFCYYHSKIHTVGVDVKFGPLLLPPPDDPAAIQLSVARINEATLTGRLDLKKAASLFTGLRIASHFIARNQFSNPRTAVQSAEQTPDGSELAPPNYVCDDDDDCDNCPHSGLCPAVSFPATRTTTTKWTRTATTNRATDSVPPAKPHSAPPTSSKGKIKLRTCLPMNAVEGP